MRRVQGAGCQDPTDLRRRLDRSRYRWVATTENLDRAVIHQRAGATPTRNLAMTSNTTGDEKNWIFTIGPAGEQAGWVQNGTWTVP